MRLPPLYIYYNQRHSPCFLITITLPSPFSPLLRRFTNFTILYLPAILRREKSYSVTFPIENIRYNGSIREFGEKRPVNMRKENRIIEIKQNFCQKFEITIKIEKQEYYLVKFQN